ncbi:MAG: class I SAM-dependent methyltransferase [Bowdeniella nasicola]|nr:class I SAM-dependent methyltransferase [Bowdeniella nasicola]
MMRVEGVQHTLVLPVVGRAIAAKRWPQNFGDVHSQRIAQTLGSHRREALHFSDYALVSYGARYTTCVEYVRRYLRRFPAAAVVDLGCGLDSMYDAVDNGQMRYYNVDFPDVIAQREALFGVREREYNIASDLRVHTFLDDIPAHNGAIFIAAGVMYYLRVGEGKALIAALAQRFDAGRLVFDHQCPAWMDRSNTAVERSGIHGATMYFRLADPMVITSWSKHIAHLAINPEWYAAVAHPEQLPWPIRALARYNRLRMCAYFVVLDFAAPAQENPGISSGETT